jgi:hypothetical protein
MNPNAPIKTGDDPPLPASLSGLWAEACDWVTWLVSMFDGATLRTTGINRTHGARLTHWLLNIEGAIRRLILAAALAATPPAPRRAHAPAAPHSRSTRARRPGFRIFRLRSSGHAEPSARAAPELKPYGHIRFPADTLLSLGPAGAKHVRRSAAPRARNPLDRWVRLSRHDPDWRSPSDIHPLAWTPRQLATPHVRERRLPPSTADLPDSLPDWRRCHDEWERAVPAPQLADRLEALARVAGNPAAAIARAARRLSRPHNAGPWLLRDAIPRDRSPRRAAHIETAGHAFDLNDRCHGALVAHDTS